MPFPRASQALSRFTVLDLTRVRSGPTCVRQLADWGANIIKIETPPHLVDGEGPGGPREGSDFQNLQRNKRSMTLDLKSPQGLAAFKRLVEKADVMVENFRPDVKDRLGIDYESLRKINKRIILGSISGFGQDGPYAKRPGFDQIAQGMGGLMSITGAPGGGPMRVGLPIADLTAGLFCALGIMTALLEREVSGEGQWVSTSLLQAQIFMLDFQAARFLTEGLVSKQAGNNHPTSIPTGVFKTKDGHLNIAVAGAVIWERFCNAVGRPEWIASPDYKTGKAAAAKPRQAQRRNRQGDRDKIQRGMGRDFQQGRACRAARSIRSTRYSPIRRSSISAWRRNQRVPTAAGLVSSASHSSCRARRARLRRGRRISASTPTRFSRNSVSRTARLTSCTRPRRYEPLRRHAMNVATKTDKMLSRKDGGVGYLIFNNPERHNAVSLDMWEAAQGILADFAADKAIRVVVVTGAGGKAFVSGADISKFESERASKDAIERYNVAVDKANTAVYEFPKPTIAMIRGYCIGGGVGLALGCDLRICSDNSKFGVPAAKLGLGYGYKGIKKLVDVVGPSFAKEIFFTARQFTAAEALTMGLVNRVLPDDGAGEIRQGLCRHHQRQRAAHRELGQIHRRRGGQSRTTNVI